jgi:HEAT repeat protein
VLFKKVVFLIITMGAMVLPGWCQVPSGRPTASDVLATLQSQNWRERSRAIEEIYDNPDVLRSAKLQAVLLDLLDKENTEPDGSSRDTQVTKPGDVEGGADEEEFAWYSSKLGEIVGSFVNWTDPRQACIMVKAAWVDYRTSAAEAAARAKAAMPCILKTAEDRQTIYREIAIPMLVEALARGQGALDSKTIGKARQIILNDLHDSEAGLRSATVIALGNYGQADVIPALQGIASSDPAFEKRDDGGKWFLVRDAAVKAIADIQKREAQR